MPVVTYKPHLKVVHAYALLAGEILPHLKGKRTGRKPNPVNPDQLVRYQSNIDSSTVETAIEI